MADVCNFTSHFSACLVMFENLKFAALIKQSFVNHGVWVCVSAFLDYEFVQEIHICWEQRANDIWNQFYSFMITIAVCLFVTLF